MVVVPIVFWSYVGIGTLLILFSKSISSYIYKMVLVFTNKANLSELFIFKTNKTQRDSFFMFARSFTVIFGLLIAFFSLYIMYFN
ncbi:MAG: hypothetical protein PF569_06000 [Candidatus Woesearchaeota archaeon]|jgi:hypothetical protein|nr:hypothetical protein [Candidatus Woesearchaeota archaeon]